MKDLKLTDNNRISFKNGDFETVEGIDLVKQRIKVAVKMLLGDWILDYRKGVDIVGGLRAYPNILKAQIKSAINEVYGVDRVLKFSFDDSTEVYKVKATVLSGGQTFDVETSINAV